MIPWPSEAHHDPLNNLFDSHELGKTEAQGIIPGARRVSDKE